LDGWYRAQKFRYSQEVPTVPNESVAAFLNDVRVGFCEHYAASSAVLLRAAGIPARVVIGFLGGTYNPIAESYTMFDRDAHAWTEYYDETQRRWVRYDPTASIQPLRFSIGSEIYRLSPEELDLAASGRRATDWLSRLTERAGLVWDAWSHELERRIVFYDASWMSRLYEDMGIPQWGPWITGFVALLSAALLLTFLRGLFRVRTKLSRGEKLWREVRAYFQIPVDIAGEGRAFEVIARAAGSGAPQVRHFAARFLRYRYAERTADRPRWRELRGEWQSLKQQVSKDGTRERAVRAFVPSASPHVKSSESAT
jgi:hypothetical protein